MITQSQLKEILHYNPDTGIFTWNITRRNAIKGSIAGYARKEYRFNYIVIRIGVLGKNYLAHRLAWLYMTGSFPTKQIDHINHDATDNRWSNLQEVTNLQNGRNQSLHSTNTSGHMGVSWNKNKWQARKRINGVQKNIGYFNSIQEAKDAIDNYTA